MLEGARGTNNGNQGLGNVQGKNCFSFMSFEILCHFCSPLLKINLSIPKRTDAKELCNQKRHQRSGCLSLSNPINNDRLNLLQAPYSNVRQSEKMLGSYPDRPSCLFFLGQTFDKWLGRVKQSKVRA